MMTDERKRLRELRAAARASDEIEKEHAYRKICKAIPAILDDLDAADRVIAAARGVVGYVWVDEMKSRMDTLRDALKEIE